MSKKMIGITGGIGSGKSVVANICKILGYAVYDADKEARKILDFDLSVKAAVKTLLGETAFLPDGLPDRTLISAIVFEHPEKLEALNKIIHPAINKHFHEWKNNQETVRLLFKEAAIMFESGSYRDMDFIITVTAPVDLRIQRVMRRDGKSESQIKKIMEKQLDEMELKKRSNFIIINDDEHLLIPQVLKIIETIKSQN